MSSRPSGFRASCGLGPRYSQAAAAAEPEYRLSPRLPNHPLGRPYAGAYHRPARERREELPRPATAPSRLPPGAHRKPSAFHQPCFSPPRGDATLSCSQPTPARTKEGDIHVTGGATPEAGSAHFGIQKGQDGTLVSFGNRGCLKLVASRPTRGREACYVVLF